MGKTDGRVQSRRRCAMKNPEHRIERLERNAAVAGANAAICVLVVAPAGMQIRRTWMWRGTSKRTAGLASALC